MPIRTDNYQPGQVAAYGAGIGDNDIQRPNLIKNTWQCHVNAINAPRTSFLHRYCTEKERSRWVWRCPQQREVNHEGFAKHQVHWKNHIKPFYILPKLWHTISTSEFTFCVQNQQSRNRWAYQHTNRYWCGFSSTWIALTKTYSTTQSQSSLSFARSNEFVHRLVQF